MVSVQEIPVTDERSQRLLSDYFATRAAEFPPEQGTYRIARPDPADFVRPAGVFLVAFDEATEPIGCGGIRRLPAGSGGRGPDATVFEIKHLWVVPRIRGTGVGRVLLQTLERRALELGGTDVVLDTNSGLIAATRMYRTDGYQEIPPYNDNPNATDWFWKHLRRTKEAPSSVRPGGPPPGPPDV